MVISSKKTFGKLRLFLTGGYIVGLNIKFDGRDVLRRTILGYLKKTYVILLVSICYCAQYIHLLYVYTIQYLKRSFTVEYVKLYKANKNKASEDVVWLIRTLLLYCVSLHATPLDLLIPTSHSHQSNCSYKECREEG